MTDRDTHSLTHARTHALTHSPDFALIHALAHDNYVVELEVSVHEVALVKVVQRTGDLKE